MKLPLIFAAYVFVDLTLPKKCSKNGSQIANISFANNLISPSSLSDDQHWVIDTDYDNYAVHYSCRQVSDDGTCLDSYSFIFSRNPNGLSLEHHNIVQQKKSDICLLNKYRRVAHNGEFSSTRSSRVFEVFYWSVPFVNQCQSIRGDTKWMIDWILLCKSMWSV